MFGVQGTALWLTAMQKKQHLGLAKEVNGFRCPLSTGLEDLGHFRTSLPQVPSVWLTRVGLIRELPASSESRRLPKDGSAVRRSLSSVAQQSLVGRARSGVAVETRQLRFSPGRESSGNHELLN